MDILENQKRLKSLESVNLTQVYNDELVKTNDVIVESDDVVSDEETGDYAFEHKLDDSIFDS